MKIGPLKPLMLSALLFTAPVVAQVMPDIGFKSVGRGWPLAVSVQGRPIVGPAWEGGLFQRPAAGQQQKLDGFPANAPPKGIKPLPASSRVKTFIRTRRYGPTSATSAATARRRASISAAS